MFNKLILPWRYMILRSHFRKLLRIRQLLRIHMNPQTLTGVPRSSKFYVFTHSQLLWCKIMFNKFSRDLLLLKIGHIGNLASTSRHQHRHWRRHRHWHSAKSLFLPFEVLCEENIHGEVLFKCTCWLSWEFQAMFRAVILWKTP